jgi:hypothetical protein
MTRILFLILASALMGIVLARDLSGWPIRPGLVGAIIMVGMALWLRWRWQHDPDAPEAPERHALLALSGNLIALFHLLASLWQIGPRLVLHTPAAHAMGVDSWTLFGAALLMGWIARAPGPLQDERDRQIAAAAFRAGHASLLLQLLALVVWLGYGRDPVLGQLTQAMLAQLLVCAWIASCAVQYGACLFAYARGHQAAAKAA